MRIINIKMLKNEVFNLKTGLPMVYSSVLFNWIIFHPPTPLHSFILFVQIRDTLLLVFHFDSGC